MRVRIPWIATVVLAAAPMLWACARYRASPLDVERPLRAAASPSPASWTYDEAVRYAVLHNPDLAALRARAAAVNLRPPREPVEVGGGVDSDHRGEFSVSLDALSLLGIGTRPHELALREIAEPVVEPGTQYRADFAGRAGDQDGRTGLGLHAGSVIASSRSRRC